MPIRCLPGHVHTTAFELLQDLLLEDLRRNCTRMDTLSDVKEGSPRILTLAGNLRRDFKLLEINEDILAEITATG